MKQNIKAAALFVAAFFASAVLASAHGSQPVATLEELELQQRAGEGVFRIHSVRNDDLRKRIELGQERWKKNNEIKNERWKEDQDLRRQRNQEDADWRRNNLLNPNGEPGWKRNREIQKERSEKDMEIKQRRFREDMERGKQRREEDAERRRKNLWKLPDLNRGRSQGLNKDRDCPEQKNDGRYRLKPRWC